MVSAHPKAPGPWAVGRSIPSSSAIEDSDTDHVLFQRRCLAANGVLGDESKKTTEPLRALKDPAEEDLLERLLRFFSTRLHGPRMIPHELTMVKCLAGRGSLPVFAKTPE